MIGAALTIYFSKNLLALDYTDNWCNLCMILAATRPRSPYSVGA